MLRLRHSLCCSALRLTARLLGGVSCGAQNPLDLLSDAKDELDAEVAKGVQKQVAKELAREKVAQERAGAQLARRLHIEEHDSALARMIHAGETAERERQVLARRKSVAEDEKVAKELAAQLESEQRNASIKALKLAAADAELAKRLQAEEDTATSKRVEELKW